VNLLQPEATALKHAHHGVEARNLGEEIQRPKGFTPMNEQCLETIDLTTQNTFEWIARIVRESHKVAHTLPKDMQSLFPALASAA
jgi:hypothetical protein